MFSEQLKEIRKKRGKTQIQLARELNVANGTVAMWETGKREPDFDTLKRIATALDVTTGYLMGEAHVLEFVAVENGNKDAMALFESEKEAPAIPEDSSGLKPEFMKLFSHLSSEQQEVVVAAMRGMQQEK